MADIEGYVTVFETTGNDAASTTWQVFVDAQPAVTSNLHIAETLRFEGALGAGARMVVAGNRARD